MNPVPLELDWLAARLACSASNLFEALATKVSADVTARVAALTEAEIRNRLSFEFSRPDGDGRNYFSVICGRKGQTVRFYLRDGAIHVSREVRTLVNDLEFTVRPTLNAAGECRFVQDGQEGELTVWQVARQALEDTFFVPPQEF